MAAVRMRVNMVVNKIPNARRAFKMAMSEALGELALRAASIAYQLCPVDTGFLRSTIAVMIRSDMDIWLVAGAEYAEFVEVTQPFIRPAIESVRNDFAAVWGSITGRIPAYIDGATAPRVRSEFFEGAENPQRPRRTRQR